MASTLQASDASVTILPQVVGMGKGDLPRRRDSPCSSRRVVQQNEQLGPEEPQPEEMFVTLPGHPFYGRLVRILGSRKSTGWTRLIIEDPAHPGFHYQLVSFRVILVHAL